MHARDAAEEEENLFAVNGEQSDDGVYYFCKPDCGDQGGYHTKSVFFEILYFFVWYFYIKKIFTEG